MIVQHLNCHLKQNIYFPLHKIKIKKCKKKFRIIVVNR